MQSSTSMRCWAVWRMRRMCEIALQRKSNGFWDSEGGPGCGRLMRAGCSAPSCPRQLAQRWNMVFMTTPLRGILARSQHLSRAFTSLAGSVSVCESSSGDILHKKSPVDDIPKPPQTTSRINELNHSNGNDKSCCRTAREHRTQQATNGKNQTHTCMLECRAAAARRAPR